MEIDIELDQIARLFSKTLRSLPIEGLRPNNFRIGGLRPWNLKR